MGKLKRHRMFGGKRYAYSGIFILKSEATKKAKLARARGQNARIVRVKGGKSADYYAVYTRLSSVRKRQGYNARMDESLGMRRGKAKSKKQSYKSRRDESKGMSKSMGRRAYASVRSMDKGRRTRR